MARRQDWEERYQGGELPWDTGVPDEHLVDLIRSKKVSPPGRALEIGCGTGTNCLWLAEQGFEVVGVDISPTALEVARAKAQDADGDIRFVHLDFLEQDVPDGPFDFVFDRGCFHVFDDGADQVLFAERVARVLAPQGWWLSLIGSTEGPERETGPPRRSARDVLAAVEPVLELVELESTTFHLSPSSVPKAWRCLSRKREVPAQPSSRR